MKEYSEGTIVPGSKGEEEFIKARDKAVKEMLGKWRFRQTTNEKDFGEKALAYTMARRLDDLPNELMEGEEGLYQAWKKRQEADKRKQDALRAGYKKEAKYKEDALRAKIHRKREEPPDPRDNVMMGEVRRDANGNVVGFYDQLSNRQYGAKPESPAGPNEETGVFRTGESRKSKPHAKPGFVERLKNLFG